MFKVGFNGNDLSHKNKLSARNLLTKHDDALFIFYLCISIPGAPGSRGVKGQFLTSIRPGGR